METWKGLRVRLLLIVLSSFYISAVVSSLISRGYNNNDHHQNIEQQQQQLEFFPSVQHPFPVYRYSLQNGSLVKTLLSTDYNSRHHQYQHHPHPPPPPPQKNNEISQSINFEPIEADSVRKMFEHGYNSYMKFAYPADQIRPISCAPHSRSGGSYSEAHLGGFSLQLVESLDTLYILNNTSEMHLRSSWIVGDKSSDTDPDSPSHTARNPPRKKPVRKFGFQSNIDSVPDLPSPHPSHKIEFNSNDFISVFETNIRMLGGLLSSYHLLHFPNSTIFPLQCPLESQTSTKIRLLISNLISKLTISFYPRSTRERTSSNSLIPYSYISLNTETLSSTPHNPPPNWSGGISNLASVGTYLLEFGFWAILTGDDEILNMIETSAKQLADKRNKKTGLMGSLIDLDTGNWLPDPFTINGGIGSGSDSYYEYLWKYYLLTGNLSFLKIFHSLQSSFHSFNLVSVSSSSSTSSSSSSSSSSSLSCSTSACKKFNYYLDCDIETGFYRRNWVDAFQTFYPQLLLSSGNLQLAIENWSFHYLLLRKFNFFIPEIYNLRTLTSHNAGWPLRPEFIEATYYLYTATKDPFFKQVTKQIVVTIERYAKSMCGYTVLKDTRSLKWETGGGSVQEDQMDSFFLAETVKYLYLILEDDNFVNKDEYLFNTEAHILPVLLFERQDSTKSARSQTNQDTSEQDTQQEQEQEQNKEKDEIVNNQEWYYCKARESLFPYGNRPWSGWGVPDTFNLDDFFPGFTHSPED